MSDIDETELIAMAQDGDKDAFGMLYETHSEWIYRLILSRVSNPEDARDLVQECFLRAFQALPQFELGANFRAWLTGIAKNTVNEHLRKKYRWEKHGPKFVVDFLSQNMFTAEIDGVIDAHALMEQIQSELNETLFKILKMRIMEGQTTEEVARLIYGEDSEETRHRVASGLYKAVNSAHAIAKRFTSTVPD